MPHVDVSRFALISNLANIKTEVDKLDIDKLTPVPNDLAKPTNVVKKDVVKKTEYNKIVTKADIIDTTNFVKETKYEKDGSDFENKINEVDKKIPDVSGLVRKTDFNSKITEVGGKIPNVNSLLTKTNFNAKITEVKGKIPDIKNLASKIELFAVKNKIPNVSNLVTKADYAAEITKIKNDYATNAALDARHKDLVQKTTFKSELKKVDDKVSANSSKVLSYEHKLKQREDTINDLERDDSYFRGKHYFGDDGMQNYFVFHPIYNSFNRVGDSTNNTAYVHYWQSKGLSNVKINAPGASSCNVRAPVLEYEGAGIKLKFNGDLLRQNKVTYNHGKIINIYIFYKLSPSITSDITPEDCLFRAVKRTKILKFNTYSGYGIAFDSKESFSYPGGGYGKNL